MAISLEPQFHTRGVVAPETRFALRRWLQALVQTCNAPDADSWNTFFTDAAIFTGWHTAIVSPEDWRVYLLRCRNEFPDYVFRYAELTVEHKGALWELRGVLEEYVGGLLVTQGQVTLIVVEAEEGFQLREQTFLPRLLVNPETL